MVLCNHQASRRNGSKHQQTVPYQHFSYNPHQPTRSSSARESPAVVAVEVTTSSSSEVLRTQLTMMYSRSEPCAFAAGESKPCDNFIEDSLERYTTVKTLVPTKCWPNSSNLPAERAPYPPRCSLRSCQCVCLSPT